MRISGDCRCWGDSAARRSGSGFRATARRPAFRRALRVGAIDHALQCLPEDPSAAPPVLGELGGTHTRDIPPESSFDIVVKARAHAIWFEDANPRHAHEWEYFSDHALPDGKNIVPGVLDSTTNFVEHPELVADRLVRCAELVGRETSSPALTVAFRRGRGRSR